MATLKYVGLDASVAADIAYEEYVTSVKSSDLSTGDVDTRILAGLAPYATISYADTKDALNATRAYVDTQDNLRVKIAQKDVINGVPGLDAAGRVNQNRINVASSQAFNRGPWSPAAYHTAQSLTSETTLFTCAVTDPGYPYKLLCYGNFDMRSSLVTEYPIVQVREGTAGGAIIAQGRGLQDSYNLQNTYSDNFNTGGVLDLTKWGLSPAAGRGNIILSPGTGGNGYVTYSNVIQSSVWVGPQPTTDKYSLQVTYNTLTRGQNRFYIHANAGWTSWVALHTYFAAIGNSTTEIHTGTDPNGITSTVRASLQHNSFGVGAIPSIEYDDVTNTYTAKLSGVTHCTWTDTTNLIPHGPGNRGFGITVNPTGALAVGSQEFDNFIVTEPGSNPLTSAVNLIPVNAHSQTAKTGATTLYITALRSGSAATMNASIFNPSIHVMAVPA